ncbi:class I SAM-dependent methyltransferase [Wenzhouxiangella sp. EGI_FJ10409]|uniref:class I SAM-dependent methyltransferase n=1 Tax=Wenzhouxiangella sp. EGI_FJ10409 TaxID=3243767 RepID=UPI0035D7D148
MSGPHTRIYDDVNSIRKAAIRAAPAIGLLLEFGVFKGDSIVQFRRWLDERDDTRDIVGFDSFEGFSEIWGGMAKKWSKDTFDLKGEAPSETRGIRFVKGFVEETLPDFLGSSDGEKISFVHIDTDTYSPAKAILSECREHFGEGAVILFDQLMGYPNWRQHEFRALVETFDVCEYNVLGFAAGNDGKGLVRTAIQVI